MFGYVVCMRMRADRESLRLIRVDPEINRFEIDAVSVVWFEHCDEKGNEFPKIYSLLTT